MAAEQRQEHSYSKSLMPLPLYGSYDCQLMTLQTAGTKHSVARKLTVEYVLAAPFRALVNPSEVVRKVRGVLAARRRSVEQAAEMAAEPVKVPPLGLRPGEWVRVKSAESIRATLDRDGRYERLAYMDVVMDRFCGQAFRVRNRVDRFFDERTWRMMKLRNVVLLDGVHCQSEPDAAPVWAGCQRACFLFWKEAWLQPVSATMTRQSGGPQAPQPATPGSWRRAR